MTDIIITILPFMVCLFWTAVFALDFPMARPPKRWLTLFMAVSATLYLCHAIFFGCERPVPVANSVYAVCNLAVFPLYHLYIYRLCCGRLVRRHALAMLPALAIGVWAAVAYAMGASQEVRLLVGKVVFVLQVAATCWFGFRRLREFDERIVNNYSNTEMRSVRLTRGMMLVLVVCSLASAVASYVGRDFFALHPSLLVLPSALFSVLLFGVGYVGCRQEFCIDDLERDACRDDAACDPCLGDASREACPAVASLLATADISGLDASLAPASPVAPPSVPSSTPDPVILPQLAQRLDILMAHERLYLQPDLRLSDVARQLGVGRTTLSSLINQHFGVSFSDYVNAHRIRHAQRMLEADRKARRLAMLYIGEQSGFTTESSFYRAFRKHTGMTPKQWSEQAPATSGE